MGQLEHRVSQIKITAIMRLLYKKLVYRKYEALIGQKFRNI